MEVMATKRVEVREANPKKAIDTNFSYLKAMSTMEVTLWKNTRFTDETRAKGDELQIKSMAAKRKAKEVRRPSILLPLMSSNKQGKNQTSLHTKVEEEEIVKKTIDEGSLPAKAGVTKRHSAAPEIVTEEKTFQNTTKEEESTDLLWYLKIMHCSSASSHCWPKLNFYIPKFSFRLIWTEGVDPLLFGREAILVQSRNQSLNGKF
ncbi:hypothetical protein U1Q18_045747 [Sarracenia purpurea var. burkii]